MYRATFCLAAVLLLFVVAHAAAQSVTPLEQAHAHNDYEHERPLYDALSHGFTSVEADAFLIFGELFVGHDAHELRLGRTLESLYLDPLSAQIEQNGGSVFDGNDEPLTLLIDIKTDGEATYRALHEVLETYQDVLTVYGANGVQSGPVTAIISGDRPLETMQAQSTRFAGYDGRMEDLGSEALASFIPLISDNWTNVFTWMGEGEMPTSERRELERIVRTAHENGQAVRFWATPDEPGGAREAMWRVLDEVGVDHINTDDLAGLEAFLRSRGEP